MKMSKAFDLPLQRAVNELAIVDKNDCVVGWADAFSGEVARDCIVESINSYDRIQQENAEFREALREARGAISACSIQESRNDGTENRMKINALNKLLSKIDSVINKND